MTRRMPDKMQDALMDAYVGGRLLRTNAGFQRPHAVLAYHKFQTIHALERRGLLELDDKQRVATCTDEGRAWAQASIDILRGGPAA